MKDYKALVEKLRGLCSNKSELSGLTPNWQSEFIVDPHHITDRIGKNLIDPYNIIMLTREEHEAIHKVNNYQRKQELLEFIREIRQKQGFES